MESEGTLAAKTRVTVPSSSPVDTVRSRRRNLMAAGGIAGAAFLGAQTIRPDLPNPPVTADLGAPAGVEQILRRSCYDCHSNETQLRWFDRIAPAYWLVVRDVSNGRRRLNFSNLGDAGEIRQRVILFESINQVERRAMPPPAYTLIHPGAVVTGAELALLKQYVHPEGRDRFPAMPWAPNSVVSTPSEIRPAPNGLTFVRGYENWRAIAISDRFDNGTMRVILANDIAIRAIENDRIAPWPDGSAFAKVLWTTTEDSRGVLRPGAFRQIDFMVKDARNHAATLGWGWSRWLGPELLPYGNDALFASECMGCHAPMRENDFVFTTPIHAGTGHADLFNRDASLPADLAFRPLEWRVLTISVDPARRTISTVFGNDVAVEHSKARSPDPMPIGAAVARVTWSERENPHWFGARIAGPAQSAELASVGSPSDEKAPTTYEAYEGPTLRKADVSVAEQRRRADVLLGESAPFMPGGTSPTEPQ